MQVTDGQLDKAAQAARKVAADGLGLAIKWDDLPMQAMDLYRKMALAVLATLPDAPEPIEGERRFTAARPAAGSWQVLDAGIKQFWPAGSRTVAQMGSFLPDEIAAVMMRAAADAAERWHRAQKVKERKRWSVNVRAADEITGEAYNLLGPHGESSWFYASDGWDREEVELVVKRRNARLDAEEGRNG